MPVKKIARFEHGLVGFTTANPPPEPFYWPLFVNPIRAPLKNIVICKEGVYQKTQFRPASTDPEDFVRGEKFR